MAHIPAQTTYLRTMTRHLLIFLSILLSTSVFGQAPTPPSGMVGSELREWLLDNWYEPWHQDLGYSGARIEMFGTVDNIGGQITGVYTGFTQAAEAVTFPNPINTEHTIPQSFFNQNAPMRSDLHHLFPTHQDANSRRGSLSFDDVVDSATDEWLIQNGGNGITQQSNIPSSNIDGYSEVQFNVDFEPRESHKGNTARAVFYFYTMYPQFLEGGTLPEAIGDPDVFYAWHNLDPPDAQEIERNERVQDAQGNYNPYINFPDLVSQVWGYVSGLSELSISFEVYPNPVNEELRVVGLNQTEVKSIEILDVLGNVILSQPRSVVISTNTLSKGVYLVRIQTDKGVGVKRIVKS